MRRYLYLLLLVLFACSGPDEKSGAIKSERQEFSLKNPYGHWLIKEYFDNLRSMGYIGSLNTTHYGVTEIVFDSLKHDSLWLINEEVSISKLKQVNSGSGDTILVQESGKTRYRIVYNQKTKTLLLINPANSKIFHYFFAPDSICTGPAPGSAFRSSLNAVFAKHLFSAKDLFGKEGKRRDVRFGVDGTLAGAGKIKTFFIHVNGVEDNCRDLDRIDFFDGEKTYAYGMALFNQGFFLYSLVPVNGLLEKKIYKKGKVFMEFNLKR